MKPENKKYWWLNTDLEICWYCHFLHKINTGTGQCFFKPKQPEMIFNASEHTCFHFKRKEFPKPPPPDYVDRRQCWNCSQFEKTDHSGNGKGLCKAHGGSLEIEDPKTVFCADFQ